MFFEEKISFTKEEVVKNITLGFLALVLIITLSLLISKFGNDIFKYINSEVEKILSHSLTAKKISEFQNIINEWIKKINDFLKIDINYLEEIENIIG